MKKSEIVVGGIYVARVSGNFVDVRVDAIRQTVENRGGKLVDSRRYDITNLVTGRKITFRSAMKFRWPYKSQRAIVDEPTLASDARRVMATLDF